MKVKKAEFKGSFVDLKQLPDEDNLEIALVGRSNVGKSSLINKVVNRKNLAKSSSTPGKTRTINFYMINDSWYFVDLPGYGFARVSKTERLKWNRMIEGYLSKRKQLKGVIQLLDIRHVPTENDVLMKDWLLHYEIPLLLVATKADKISKGARQKHLNQIRKALDLEPEDILLPFSAATGEGVGEILAAIEELLEF
ncbi:MAG: YihA family ribosome biogenesis GTP-binding protein [Thermosyntropha sp.]|nr:YihA family ribosome biogenesis GTP-binding protein [Thermosyntropha sp.]